jgi:RecA/RadA recombinase
VLDSLDALTSEEELSRYGKKFQDGASVDGSYKTEKAKYISEILRVIVSKISQTKSFLLVLSQTRENIGFGAAFKPKVRSGGKPLDFYSSSITWLSRLSQIKEKDRKIGTHIGFKISKNKNNGKHREGKIILLNELGIDDVGSMCDYLIDEGHWQKDGKKILLNDFDDPASMFQKHIPAFIEDGGYTLQLKGLCSQIWHKIEESLNTGRKPRFE